ncbi:chymotrypsin-like protease CTRL-1 [Chironomus tepperi]|uniref:chymotrypsin-like protease CTRL-1 n=1 Tax=Chironomus tepperi TaxID=113505 RepID=UPI00391F10D3
MNSSKEIFLILLLVSNVKSENLSIGSQCETNDGTEGTCVTIDNCNILRDKLRNRIIRMNQVVVCNKFMRYVCCPAEPSLLNSRVNVDKSSSWNLIEDGPSSCGKPIIRFGTVFFGTQIKRGAYPWVAALKTTTGGNFFCGGTLISKNLVITAAHCIEEKQKNYVLAPKDIFVILGAHNLEARDEPGRITSSVRDIHIHYEWNPFVASYDADIAILKLGSNFYFNEYIQPICIAAPNSQAALKTDGIVVGYGRSENKKVENIARIITSPIVPYQFCANNSYHESLLTHRTFCGGFANGTSVCVGDSGSGLIVKHGAVYYLRGIVSSSLYDLNNGCDINSYSVFTDTLEFYSWITTGSDDKILLQTTLDENRKLKLENAKYISENLELMKEIKMLRLHTTTTTRKTM